MATVHSYFSFDGNCGEAMKFYQECLGGELVIQVVGESPMAKQLPEWMKTYVVHSSLTVDGIVLMGSDMIEDKGLIRGNNISLLLNCNSEDHIRQCYERLSEGGKKTSSLEATFWGSLFGQLVDKFGNHWSLNYQHII
jgi:PhnB protein